MPRKNIVDAGVIIAYFDKDDDAHDWATEIFSAHHELTTCEAAVSEACARLEYGGFEPHCVIQLVADGILNLEFSAQENIIRVLQLMEKYRDRPMDFADACLVVMTEKFSKPMLFTLDDDFQFYRRHGRGIIPFSSPEK